MVIASFVNTSLDPFLCRFSSFSPLFVGFFPGWLDSPVLDDLRCPFCILFCNSIFEFWPIFFSWDLFSPMRPSLRPPSLNASVPRAPASTLTTLGAPCPRRVVTGGQKGERRGNGEIPDRCHIFVGWRYLHPFASYRGEGYGMLLGSPGRPKFSPQ